MQLWRWGYSMLESTRGGAMQRIAVPKATTDLIGQRRNHFWVTISRDLATVRRDAHLLDLDSPLLHLMLEHARQHTFGGITCATKTLTIAAVIATVLRWQDAQGRRMRQELCLVDIDGASNARIHSRAMAEWLKSPTNGDEWKPDDDRASAWTGAAA